MKAHVNVPFMDRTMHFLTFPFCSSVQHLTAVRGWLLERFRGNSKITYILPRLLRNSVRCSSCSYQTDNSQEQWGWQADFAFSLDVRQPRTVRFVSISEQQLIISLCMACALKTDPITNATSNIPDERKVVCPALVPVTIFLTGGFKWMGWGMKDIFFMCKIFFIFDYLEELEVS